MYIKKKKKAVKFYFIHNKRYKILEKQNIVRKSHLVIVFIVLKSYEYNSF